jgi:hypothetical protein
MNLEEKRVHENSSNNVFAADVERNIAKGGVAFLAGVCALALVFGNKGPSVFERVECDDTRNVPALSATGKFDEIAKEYVDRSPGVRVEDVEVMLEEINGTETVPDNGYVDAPYKCQPRNG